MFPVSDGRKMLSPVRVMFLFGSRQHACIVKSVVEQRITVSVHQDPQK